MFRWLANWIIRRAQRTPYWHLEGYMNRWWLIPYNRFGIAVRVHEILRSDEDRHLHDHPWWYISIVLRGGYFEARPMRGWEFETFGPKYYRRWRGPGSIAFRRASSWHKLELPDATKYPYLTAMRNEESCWTLFITGPKRKDYDPNHSCWGFLVDGEKVPADLYLGDRYVDTNYSNAQGAVQ